TPPPPPFAPLLLRPPPRSTLFPYTTLFRSDHGGRTSHAAIVSRELGVAAVVGTGDATAALADGQEITVSCAEGELGHVYEGILRSEEHTSELQSRENLVCRLLLEKKNKKKK